jgi:8-oxo-dGTP pyrophosphatase MutT (NUDIX family)
MEILTAILENPFLWVPLATLVFALMMIYIIAFSQGREISFWPPKIGPKPTVALTKITDASIVKQQAAAFCHRKIKGKSEVLLVQTSGRRWTFPKGRIKDTSDPARVAEINALEEAGVAGPIDSVPFYRFKHWKQELKVNDGEEYLVDVFFLRVEKQITPIEEHRSPTWFSFSKAIKALSEKRTINYANEYASVIHAAERELQSR